MRSRGFVKPDHCDSVSPFNASQTLACAILISLKSAIISAVHSTSRGAVRLPGAMNVAMNDSAAPPHNHPAAHLLSRTT